MNTDAIDLLIRRELPAAANGDRDAYGRIIQASQNTVTAVALAITRDVPASEDIAQEAFLSAWQHLRRLRNPASFLPWLRQITRNLARDHLRAYRQRPLDGEAAELAIAHAADPSPSPMQRMIADEREQAAAELISALPEDSREVLLLFYREGQSSQQVAALLGLSDAAVRKRLSRARHAVREDLLKCFGEFARSSAPGAAFTAVLATALTAASPPVAAAGILSAGSMVGAKTLGKILLGAAGTIGFAIVASLAGIFLGLRSQLPGAIDERERRELIRSAVISALASVVFVVAMLVISKMTTGWLPPVVATFAFMAVVFYQAMAVQPRAMSRRHALEASRDPVAAARQAALRKIVSRTGIAIGTICGCGGLIAGLIASGRVTL